MTFLSCDKVMLIMQWKLAFVFSFLFDNFYVAV